MIIKSFKVFESVNDDISTLEDIFVDVSDEFNVHIISMGAINVFDMLLSEIIKNERPMIKKEDLFDKAFLFIREKAYTVFIDGVLDDTRVKEIVKRCEYENFSPMFIKNTTMIFLKDKDKIIKNILEVI